MTADGITNTAEGGTIYNKSKDILNEASGDILNLLMEKLEILPLRLLI